MPLIDSTLSIQNSRLNNSHPLVDIYVHTIITPMNNRSSTNQNTNSSSDPAAFLNLLANSRHNTNLTENNNINSNSNTNLNANGTTNDLQLDNTSNVTLNSIGNTLLGNQRHGDELQEPTAEDRIINTNIENSNVVASNFNNQNLVRDNNDNIVRERISSGSSYDIILEEFYENENEAGNGEEEEESLHDSDI